MKFDEFSWIQLSASHIKQSQTITAQQYNHHNYIQDELQKVAHGQNQQLIQRRTTKIRDKAVKCDNFGCFSNCENCRTEVADDVISDVTVDKVGANVRVKFAYNVS